MNIFANQLNRATAFLSNFKNHFLLALFFSVIAVTGSAQNFTVTSNNDTHAVSQTTSALDAFGQVTLRSACEASTNIAGSHIITIPGNITTINLSLGQITIGNSTLGNNITINGGGKAVLTINQTTLNRVFFTGNLAITFNVNDLTLNYAGPAGSISSSGGCTQAGGVGAVTTMTNVAINNFNIANGNGGAFSCSSPSTGTITLTNCDFNNNFCGGGGGAVNIVTSTTATLTNCKFSGNSTGNISGAGGSNTGGSGGALSTSGNAGGGTYNVTNCTFINNHQTTTAQGGAIMNTNGTLNVSFCRFVNNTAAVASNGNVLAQAGGAGIMMINADNNWWGQNSGPAVNDEVVLAAGGTITTTKWLQLKTSISTNPLCTGGSATVTASFLSNSAAEAVTNTNVSTLIGQPISFVNPTLGSLSGAQATIQNNGQATVTFTAGGTAGTGSVNAVVDNIPNNDVAPAKVSFTINPGSAVTGNPSNTTVCAGANANFSASFSGTPTPTIQWQVSTNGGGIYNNIAGATTSPLTFATVAGNNGNLYRAVGTNTCGSINTTGALLIVNTAPAVTGNPSNQSVPAGSNASFNASFSGSPTPTLQWQVSTNGGANYNNIAGATSSPLVFTTNLSQSGNLYRAVGTNICSAVNTTGALLTVTNACATSSVIAVSGASSICAGQQANIKVTITGGASPFTVVYNNGTGNTSVPAYTSGSNIPVSPATTTTYTITSVTDANSCVGSGNSGSATITVNPAINPGITNNSGSTVLTCSLTSISVTATGGTSYLWDGGATPNTAANSFISPGTYHVTVTGAGGCNAQAQITITQNITPPTAGITNNSGSTVLTCSLTSISVTATGGVSYSWDGGATPNTAANSFSSPGTYTVTVTGANGCTSQAQITLTQNVTPPTAGITNNTGTIQLDCTITSISVTATGGVSYSWDGGATPNTAANSFSSPGTYHVIVTGANGCTSQAQITITQSVTPPTAGITNNSGSTVLTCSLTSISVTATGGVSYSWDGGATPNTAANSFSSPGTYTVTVTAAGGCTAQAQITITQNITPPTAGITNNTGTTQLDCTITSISVTATGGVSYSWDGGATPNTAANSFSSPGTYHVIVTGANGCTSQVQITITQNITPPTAGITNNSGSTVLTCSLTSISVTATGGVSYSWDGGATPNTAANSFSSPGTYTVTVTAAGGCTAQAQITLTQNITPPTAGITNNTGTTLLDCTITSISVTATGGVSYSWDGGATPNTAANSFSSPGTYHVIVTGANGCTSQAQISITQNTGLPATPGPFTGIVNVCPYINNGTQLTYSVPAVPGATFNWIIPPTANLISGQGTNSIVITLSAAFVNAANKQIRVTATSSCGTSQLAIFYMLAQGPGTPSPITGSGVNVCPIIGTSNTYTYTISSVTGATSYLWTAQAGTAIINETNGPGINDTTVTVSFLNGFTNSAISVRSQNGCGISNSRSLSLTANLPPAPSPIAGPTNACEFIAPNGLPATYTVTNDPANTYTWIPPAGEIGLTGQGSNSIGFVFPNGFTSGIVRVTATNGCGTSAIRSLSISKLSPAALSQMDVIQAVSCPDRTYTYSVAAMPANATSIVWTVPTAAGAVLLSGQGTKSISVSYPGTAVTGNVTATATSNCGSSATRSVSVKLPVCPDLPPPPPPFAKTTTAPVISETMHVNIFPNPTVSDFKLQVLTAGKEKISVRIIDMQGRELKQFAIMPYQTTTIGSGLYAGSYMLELRQGKEVKMMKLMKF